MYIIQYIILLLLSITVFYPNSERLAIGDKIWFGDWIYNITSKIKNNTLSTFITKVSYSKLFTCRPCITFHQTWIFHALTSIVDSNSINEYLLRNLLIGIPTALVAYWYVKIDLKDD